MMIVKEQCWWLDEHDDYEDDDGDGCDEDEKHDDDEVDVDGNDGDMIRCRVRSWCMERMKRRWAPSQKDSLQMCIFTALGVWLILWAEQSHMYKHIFVTMGILHTPYMVIMSMVSMVIMRLMYEVDGPRMSSVSERIGERSLQMCIYTALAV